MARQTKIIVRSITDARKAVAFAKTVSDVHFIKFADATVTTADESGTWTTNQRIMSIGTKYIKIPHPDCEGFVFVKESHKGHFWIEISFYK